MASKSNTKWLFFLKKKKFKQISYLLIKYVSDTNSMT